MLSIKRKPIYQYRLSVAVTPTVRMVPSGTQSGSKSGILHPPPSTPRILPRMLRGRTGDGLLWLSLIIVFELTMVDSFLNALLPCPRPFFVLLTMYASEAVF